jgi:hypothetical protein
VPRGWAQPESEAVELFMDRLPDRYVGFGDMELNVAGTPGEASGDFEGPGYGTSGDSIAALWPAAMSVRAVCGMEKICGEQAQEEKGFVCGKARGGVAPCLGLPSQIAALHAVGGRHGDGPEAGRVLALSVVFVVLDPSETIS